ncbi:hypothetical protein ONZ45_g19514 [Pleurotus djamor]|nr:hypothetical protein ONZ45_g19514 [Pleurotus djamor]
MSANANIWVASSDGNLQRVRQLIEQDGLSPNVPDENTYTPMHAAASYGHISLLQYLIEKGGDVNVKDHDGDTPLYTVENVQTARFLLDSGATLDIRNNDGLSPIDHLAEDFPDVAAYLQTRLPHPQPPQSSLIPTQSPLQNPSQHAQHVAADSLTSDLIQTVQSIMDRAEQTNTAPDEEALRIAVTRSVLQGVAAGIELSAIQDNNNQNDPTTSDELQAGQRRPADDHGGDQKRSRME